MTYKQTRRLYINEVLLKDEFKCYTKKQLESFFDDVFLIIEQQLLGGHIVKLNSGKMDRMLVMGEFKNNEKRYLVDIGMKEENICNIFTSKRFRNRIEENVNVNHQQYLTR